MSEGSLWRKWDLHIHSPLSILNNQFPKLAGNPNLPDWERYITQLESLDFAVLGITDYFSVDGYREVLRFQQEEERLTNKLLLPNVELRLNVTTGDNTKRINLHVIFSDDIGADEIERHFLNELHFTSSGNPQNLDEQEKLMPENLEDLGNKLRQENPSKFPGLSDLKIGATVAVVDHSEVSKLLQSRRFRDKYLLILAEEGLSDLDWWSQTHNIRRTLIQKADMIFTSNPDSILWYLGKKGYATQQDYIDEFQSLKPCVHGSDAHVIDEIGWPCAKRGDRDHKCDRENPSECELRYCWIKTDPTFDGLKQLLYEPEDRVRIQSHDPTPARHNYTLSRVRISHSVINNELTVPSVNIPLNRGLVTVTGGRGAGKTALVDLIAHCFQNRIDTTDKNSFVGRINGEQPDLRTTLNFVDAAEFTKLAIDEITIEETDLSYISQGELNEYIGQNSGLSKRINDLVFSSVTEVHRYNYENLLQTIEGHEATIIELSRQIIRLENDTSQTIKDNLVSERKRVEAELRDIERQVQDIEKDADDDAALKAAQDAQHRVSELKQRKEKLQNLKQLLVKTKTFLLNELALINEDIESINLLLQELHLNGVVNVIVYDSSLIDTHLPVIEEEITKVLTAIDNEQTQLETLQSQVSTHAKLLDEQQEKAKDLEQIRQREGAIETLESELRSTIQERAKCYRNMLKAVAETQEKYAQIIEHFSQQLSTSASKTDTKDVLKDLEFFAEIHFDRGNFLTVANDLFDGRSVHVYGEDSPFQDTLVRFDNFTQQTDTGLEDLAGIIEQHAGDKTLRAKIKNNKNIDLFDYFRCFYSNYFSIVPIVRYKNTSLEHLSLGQKATVLIKIYLAQGRKPIVIDSHDDHLDNQFIMDELIPAIRQAKNFRQIILVSNNANVVVNTDAEQIIVAERNGVEITFDSGSLENPRIRDKALRVLEGGEEAFRKRQEKYRLI